MFGQVIRLFRDSSAVRHFSLVGLATIGGGLVAAHLVATALDSAPEVLAGALPRTVATSRQAQAAAPMRSVLDDDVTTGSIGSRVTRVTLDPCTGARR